MAQPLPAHGPDVVHFHGTCPVLACRDAHNERQRRRRRLMAYQQWAPFTEAEPVRVHVRGLLDDPAQAWSIQKISAASKVPTATIAGILYERGTKPRRTKIRSETAQALLEVRPNLDSYKPKALIAALGTQRRIQAMYRRGWPLVSQGEVAGVGSCAGQKIPGYRYVTAATARAFRDMYNRLWDESPEHHGIDPRLAAMTRADGTARGWAPPSCWDEETLDDPAGFPDWTGHCGSAAGWLLHNLDGQEPCAACATAALEVPYRRSVRELAETCGEGLVAVAAAGTPWRPVSQFLGVPEYRVSRAYTMAKKMNLEAAA